MIRALIRLYPRAFRERYGDELAAFHAERIREGTAQWPAILLDHLGGAATEHLREMRERVAPRRKSPGDPMNVLLDIKYAVRSLGRRPGFTAVVLATLALGIGVNAAIFSVVNGILLRPLPYPHADRVVQFGHKPPHWLVSEPQYLEYKQDLKSFETLAMYSQDEGNLATGEEPERIAIARVTPDFFQALGVRPELGRPFTADEDRATTPTVAIISYALWQRRFAGDPRIVGSAIDYNGVKRVVVGVMPQHFDYPTPRTDVWLPLHRVTADSLAWANHYLFGLGRLRAGVTPERVFSEADIVAKRIMADHADTFDPKGAPLVPVITRVSDALVGNARPYLIALFGAVGFVLLIVCANVANLLLARGEGRRKEMALRTALGASSARLATQLFTEALLLGLGGGVVGLGVAWLGDRALLAVAPSSIPRLDQVTLDWRVALFTFAASVVTALIFGLAPAVRATREAPAETLKEGGKTSSAQGGSHRARRTLVVAEVALAMVMLTGAGMLLRSLMNLQSNDMGFDARNVLTLQVSPAVSSYDDARTELFYRQLLERVRAIPGVRAAGAAGWLPVVGIGGLWGVLAEGQTYAPAHQPAAVPQQATPGFLKAMGMRVIEGRDITDEDRLGALNVGLVSKSMANMLWPNEDAVGKRFRLGGNKQWVTVVGVVNDFRSRGFSDTPEPTMYFVHSQAPSDNYYMQRSMSLAIRTAADPLGIVNQVRAAVRAIDPTAPVSDVRTLEQVVGTSVADRRFSTALIAAFAALAMLLAGIGIFGVISYGVSERRFEIGVRMALGADRTTVVALVLRDGLRMTLLGIVIGVVGAAATARAIKSMLVDVPTIDVLTIAVMGVVLAAVAVAASMLPARRATAVSPTDALRGG